MDHAVALIEAYLQINGYFTVSEYPIIESKDRRHYEVATDLDILGFRFPGAGRQITGREGGEQFSPDPALGVDGTQPDMLIGEVKEGRAQLNRAARSPYVLRSVLARFGCCSIDRVHQTVQKLIRNGEATTATGHHVRLVAFGSSTEYPKQGRYLRISLAHVSTFIDEYLNEHWDVLRHVQIKHQALGLLIVLEKARREGADAQTAGPANGIRSGPVKNPK